MERASRSPGQIAWADAIYISKSRHASPKEKNFAAAMMCVLTRRSLRRREAARLRGIAARLAQRTRR